MSAQTETQAVIRDWIRRRNTGVRSERSAARNARYILQAVATERWATDFVAGIVAAAGYTVGDDEVRATAAAMLDERLEQERQAGRERAEARRRVAEITRYSPGLVFTAEELA